MTDKPTSSGYSPYRYQSPTRPYSGYSSQGQRPYYTGRPYESYGGPYDHPQRYGGPYGGQYGGPYGGPYGGQYGGQYDYLNHPSRMGGTQGQGHSAYAQEQDRANEKEVTEVKDERREKLRQQAEAEEALEQAKRQRSTRVDELSEQLQGQKLTAEGKSAEQNRAVADYNYSPQRSQYNYYNPYYSAYSYDHHRQQLDKVGETRQERTQAVSEFQQSKQTAEKEAEELDRTVEQLESQLHSAKEARRRNSIRLESAVTKQEAGPQRSHGGYGYSGVIADQKTKNIKADLDLQQKLDSMKPTKEAEGENK